MQENLLSPFSPLLKGRMVGRQLMYHDVIAALPKFKPGTFPILLRIKPETVLEIPESEGTASDAGGDTDAGSGADARGEAVLVTAATAVGDPPRTVPVQQATPTHASQADAVPLISATPRKRQGCCAWCRLRCCGCCGRCCAKKAYPGLPAPTTEAEQLLQEAQASKSMEVSVRMDVGAGAMSEVCDTHADACTAVVGRVSRAATASWLSVTQVPFPRL